MAKKCIRLRPDERESLEALYVAHRIPSDQWVRRPDELVGFISDFNKLTGSDYLPGEVLHYMYSQRKQKMWPTFGGGYKKLAPLPDDVLSDDEWEILREEYLKLGIGSDNFVFDDALCFKLEETFGMRAGRVVSGRVLFAAIMKKRKRGLWPKVGTKAKEFADFDAVAEKYVKLRKKATG